MDLKANERKWQQRWNDTKLYAFHPENADKKWYVLEMFSYPSGARLHLGHWYNYGPSDTYARLKRMQGYEVFQPMGFDAFGLPAENYAIKTGVHPKDSTLANIDTMKKQLTAMGATFNWDATLTTCSPDYYRWTQWCFLQLYKHGLAYRKNAPVNFCPSCNTVLANEQVVDGLCERCDSVVVRKHLTQWFFKITDYAQELLDCLDDLDWPEKTKAMQRNWIGRSTGSTLTFQIADSDLAFDVFTTRADTLFGCTYAVLAPEHTLVDAVTTPEHKAEVEAYRAMCARATEIERQSTTREKTGVFTGAYCINPINGRKVPLWIADYVLATYGSGAVMAVPAHDERDFAFATKYSLPIEGVILAPDHSAPELPYHEDGIMVNSPGFDGTPSAEGRVAITRALEQSGKGSLTVNYRLRDWLISRQRYWGAPIPIVYCEDCGAVPVPEDQLPVLLPYDVNFTPDGSSPLLRHEGFVNTVCPKCGKPAKRETDTMDTFVCSSWYFLRYADSKNDRIAFDTAWIDKMLPVDKYIGGAEHACMHLLYARFFTKALRDMGYLHFDEPFLSLIHQGTILGPDGNKMSKSKGNVISPDDYIDKYGADVLRMYLMFGFAFVEGGAWNEDGIKAIHRYLERVERLVEKVSRMPETSMQLGAAERELSYALHYAIRQVTVDTDRFQFNTAIARLMELVNAMYKYLDDEQASGSFVQAVTLDLIRLLAPFAPHFAEELWERMGQPYSVCNEPWPIFDPACLVRDELELGVQINSKLRTKIVVAKDATQEQMQAAALSDPKVQAALEGKDVKKVIVVKGRLVNIVAK